MQSKYVSALQEASEHVNNVELNNAIKVFLYLQDNMSGSGFARLTNMFMLGEIQRDDLQWIADLHTMEVLNEAHI